MMRRFWMMLILAALPGFFGCDEEGSKITPADSELSAPPRPEVVLVSMGGWIQTAGTMQHIERTMIQQIKAAVPGARVTVKRRIAGLLPVGDSELFLGLEYAGWKARKKTPEGRNDIFIAVGHSSGATAIYGLTENGTFEDGPCAPALLGMVDMVLPIGPHDLSGKVPGNGGRKTRIVHYHLPETPRIRGIRNVAVHANHFSVVNSGMVLHGLAAEAGQACRDASLQQSVMASSLDR